MDISSLIQALSSFKWGWPFLVTTAGLVLFALGVLFGQLSQKAAFRRLLKSERADAVKRSRAVLGGQFAEQLAPYLPGFPCNPGDCQFLGRPVDFVAFPGSAEGREVTDVVFIEVKGGESQLTQREREIRRAVEKGRVHYVEYRLPLS